MAKINQSVLLVKGKQKYMTEHFQSNLSSMFDELRVLESDFGNLLE